MKKLATLILAAALVCNAAIALAKPHEPKNMTCELSQSDVESLFLSIYIAGTKFPVKVTNENEDVLVPMILTKIDPQVKKLVNTVRKECGLPEWKEK